MTTFHPLRAGKDHKIYAIAHAVPYGGLLFGARALILQVLHPSVGVGVAKHSTLRARPVDRLRRTSEYVLATAFADDATLLALIDRVNQRHVPVKGKNPVSGATFSANDPRLQEWVHLTELEALLDSYKFIGGVLTAEEESAIYDVTRFGPMLLGSPDEAASSLERKEAFYKDMIGELALTDETRDLIDYLLMPASKKIWWAWPMLPIVRRFTIAQLPAYAREKLGLTPTKLGDAIVSGFVRLSCKIAHPILVWLNWKLVGAATKAIFDAAPDQTVERGFTVPVPRERS